MTNAASSDWPSRRWSRRARRFPTRWPMPSASVCRSCRSPPTAYWKRWGKEAPMQAFEYVTPTKKQVATLLGGQASILAGGTDLLALMKDDVVNPKRLVNIKAIDGLRGIG